MRLLIILLMFWNAAVAADEVTICYNYDCAAKADVKISDKQLLQIKQLFIQLPDSQAERTAISQAIGLFETFSGEQTPTSQDKGGNVNDDGVNGRMDCIDHSTNTTAYLRLLEKRGLLKFHRVLAPVKRAPLLLNPHWGALIEEIDNMHDFVVDSWFFDNGHPAMIFELDDWLKGASPHV